MVVFVTFPEGSGPVANFLKKFGHAYARKMAETTYLALVRRGSLPGGVVVFGDRDRMSEPQRMLAARLWDQLSNAGPGIRLLNNPMLQLDRYELLKRLHQEGINDFDLWRASELPADIRFPVFLRLAKDHSGPKSELLYDEASLLAALAPLLLAGHAPQDLLIVEYIDTRDEAGHYRKYGAYRIGDFIFCKHLMVGRDWALKGDVRFSDEASIGEDTDYFVHNPHVDLLRPIFEHAQIEFGRIDYTFKGDRIQVWEINDNPEFASPHAKDIEAVSKAGPYVQAIDALSDGLPRSGPISFDLFEEGVWQRFSDVGKNG